VKLLGANFKGYCIVAGHGNSQQIGGLSVQALTTRVQAECLPGQPVFLAGCNTAVKGQNGQASIAQQLAISLKRKVVGLGGYGHPALGDPDFESGDLTSVNDNNQYSYKKDNQDDFRVFFP